MRKLLDFSTPHVLHDSREYDSAIREIGRLLDAAPVEGTDDYSRLEFLSLLVEDYEDRNIPMPAKVRAQDAVDFMLEQKGLRREDLHGVMGGRSRV